MSARRILRMQRNNEKIKKKEQLKNMGIVVKRALPFIRLNGVTQTMLAAYT
jgi:predicted DNA-binding helix-hairpin-helix protein